MINSSFLNKEAEFNETFSEEENSQRIDATHFLFQCLERFYTTLY